MPESSYSFLGAVEIQERKVLVAAQFIGNVPVMLAGKLDGEFSMGILVQTLTGLNVIPAALDLTLKDSLLYMVPSPLGATIGDEHFPTGLSLKGILSFMGLTAKAEVTMDPDSGVIASGELDKPIMLEPVFRLTGMDGKGTPLLKINTAENPLLTLEGEFFLLGLKERVLARAGDGSLTFTTRKVLGPVAVQLACALGHGVLTAEGEAVVMIRGAIGPIRPVANGPSLGSIKIDTGFDALLKVRAEENGAWQLLLSGTAEIVSVEIHLPEMDISGNIQDLEKLPELILKLITERATELLEEVFGTAEQWLEHIAAGLVHVVEEEIGKTLSEYYHKTTEEVSQLVHSILKLDAKGILSVLKGAGTGAEDAAKLLIQLGVPSQVVKEMLNIAFPGSHLDHHYGHIDTPGMPHLDIPMQNTMNIPGKGHVDVPEKFHVDQGGKGHVNEGGQGHIDEHWDAKFASHHTDRSAIPHVDVQPVPHVNDGATPHVNVSAVPHVNVVTPHVDVTTPHADSDTHLDTN
jgi:hypothetical protein